MKKTAYVYKLKSKYVKNYKELLGMYPCFSLFEGEGERIIAMKIQLPFDSLITQGIIKRIEFLYEKGTSKERKEWNDNGYEFTEVLEPDQSTHWCLNMTDEIRDEATDAEFCISLASEDKGFLFVQSPDKITYYNEGIFADSGLKDLIDSLLKHNVIYRKRVRYGNA